MMYPIIIGIAGGSGSGKTTFAQNLKKDFENEIVVLSHDFYYKNHDDLSFEERKKLNFDHPNAFDTDMLVEQLKDLKAGKTIEHPVYSFVRHNREDYTVKIEPKKIILVEGILIFENKELRDMMDIKIFVDTDADIRFIRRLVRDVNERGRTIESIIEQYCSTVKPMHEQFVEYSKKYADIIVPEGGNNKVALAMVKEQIKNILYTI
ncbi:MAG: uridine kinase [Clostridia bacterium]|nr:uridine kinase [Clostridia bacterium]